MQNAPREMLDAILTAFGVRKSGIRTGLTPSTFSGVGTAGSVAEASPKVWRFVADFVSEWGFSGKH